MLKMAIRMEFIMDKHQIVWPLILVCCVEMIHQIKGEIIDPQVPGQSLHIHCLNKDKTIQIKDPFHSSLANDNKFVAMEWYQYKQNGTEEVELLGVVKGQAVTTFKDRFTSFEFWGLQISNVETGDSAVYKAKLSHQTKSDGKQLEIIVASPPVLETDKLSPSQAVDRTSRSVTLSCGRISNLGSPPIGIIIRLINGTGLHPVYRNGNFEITIPAKEAELVQFSCEVNMSAPAASCIPPSDIPRWLGAIPEKSTQAAGIDLIPIIAGVVGGVVVLVIIVVVIVCVIKKRNSTSSTYNTKDHEEKRGRGQKQTPLLKDDNEKLYDEPSVKKTPIYTGGNSSGPYMVSNVSQDSEYEEVGTSNGRQAVPPPVSGRFIKKDDEKNKKKSAKDAKKDNNNEMGVAEKPLDDDPKPPRAKPRSIFLTPSMEELDKIGRAVAGGEGSGANGVMGTAV